MVRSILFSLIILFSFAILSIQTKKYHIFGENDSSTSISSANQRLLIDIDIYNRPYVLPYFLFQLEKFTCPCAQCYLDLRVYRVFNTPVEEETHRLVEQWVSTLKTSNQQVYTKITLHHWTNQTEQDQADRLNSVISRVSDLDITYLAMFDSMIILFEPEKLFSILISKDKPLMTPLLRSTKGMYTSTFYLNNQQSTGYEAYQQIYDRKKLGCFLINGGIKDFYFFNFQYSQIRNVFLKTHTTQSIDLIARQNSLPTYVCNREQFGYIPVQYLEAVYDEKLIEELYIHMLIEHQLNGPSQTYLSPIRRSALIDFPQSKEKTKFGLDEIYVVNLVRRPDRRERLQSTFDILNISARFFDAIDGKHTIDRAYLEKLQIRLLPDYEDPYNLRPMNYGELGCFFSHFFIWEDMIKNNYVHGAMILEDDVRFDASFKRKLERVLSSQTLDWDLIFLGRKIMRTNEENYDKIIEEFLIEPSYSHWTVGYLLSLRGAKMLVEERPLQKILPVDEYLPIMYNHHPNENWKRYFTNRNLKAYAFQPAIITPTHYFGEPNYISDTENTTILGNESTNEEINRSKIVSVDVIAHNPKDEL